jgi:hypothetical protein
MIMQPRELQNPRKSKLIHRNRNLQQSCQTLKMKIVVVKTKAKYRMEDSVRKCSALVGRSLFFPFSFKRSQQVGIAYICLELNAYLNP